MCLLPFIVDYVISARGGQMLFESSGRTTLMKLGMNIFIKKPIFGIGVGVEKWVSVTSQPLPHNMIVQYLVQMGIVGSIIIHIHFIILFNNYWKNKTPDVWPVLLSLLGAMAVPDIVSSRFLSILVIILILNSHYKKYNLKTEKERLNIEKIRENIIQKY